MKNYKRLSFEEREEISRMLAKHCSLQKIAHALGRHISTISREVRAGSCNKYMYQSGQSGKDEPKKISESANSANVR